MTDKQKYFTYTDNTSDNNDKIMENLHKQIIIDVCPYQGECSVSGCKRNDDGCFVRQLFEERYRAENQIVELNKTIQAKEQECENNKTAYQTELDIYNQECLNLQEELKEAFEQLDQLKAENKELKEQYNCYACDTCKGKEDYINLKRHCENAIKSLHNKQAEFDQLKTENDELEKWKKEHLKDVEFIERNPVIDILNSMADNILLEQRNEKLKQTLAEIKEIAEKFCSESCPYKDDDCDICVEDCLLDEIVNPILQKISECEGNDGK